jgi:hypothetical protein
MSLAQFPEHMGYPEAGFVCLKRAHHRLGCTTNSTNGRNLDWGQAYAAC